MEILNENFNGREKFKKFLKTWGYDSIRQYSQAILYKFRTETGFESKRAYLLMVSETLEEQFGLDVKNDVFYIISKLHKEEERIEEAILNNDEKIETFSDEYEKMCLLEDKYDFDERKAMKEGKRDLSFYDGHINDIEDYNIGFNEDEIKIYTPEKNVVRRKLKNIKKFTK